MYELEWMFHFIERPVVGKVESEFKAEAAATMIADVRDALGDSFTAEHAAALRNIERSVKAWPSKETLEISARSLVVRLTTLPGPE